MTERSDLMLVAQGGALDFGCIDKIHIDKCEISLKVSEVRYAWMF